MKTKTYLKVTEKPIEELQKFYDEPIETSSNLIIIDINDREQMEKVIDYSKKFDKDHHKNLGLVVNEEIFNEYKNKLHDLKKDDRVTSFVEASKHNEIKTLNLISPLYKFDIKSDSDLEKIGKLADFLQIPYVSKVIDVYTTGKGLKEDLEAEDKGFIDYSTIVGDLASILGLEKVEKVTDFIDSVDTLKSNIKKEGGAYEVKKVYKSGSDIVDTIRDVIDSD